MKTGLETAEGGVSNVNPGLATTYEGGDPDFLEKAAAIVDFIEIVPDCIARSDGNKRSLHQETLSELQKVRNETSIIAHGIGLSIGSHEGYSDQYLRLLDELMESVQVVWHSEHLGYTTVDGVNLGTMLPVPMTNEALDTVSERAIEIRQRYGLPFLLENVAHVLPTYSDGYSAAGFLNAVARESGCHLLLDAYNLECDAHNHGLNLNDFFDELEADSVWEVHLANGTIHRGLQLDVHSKLTQKSTLEIAKRIRSESRNLHAITYELLSQAIPVLGHDAIIRELQHIKNQVL